MEEALLLAVMKHLFLDIPARNLVSVLTELTLQILLSKINRNPILTITSSGELNKKVDSTRTESVMLTDANKKTNGVVHYYLNKTLNIN
jgi:hypothetical protein